MALDMMLRQLLQQIRLELHEAIEQNISTERLTNMLEILLEAVRDVRIAPVRGSSWNPLSCRSAKESPRRRNP